MNAGIYFLNQASLESVKRFLSGILATYRTYHLSDIQVYHFNGAVMVLVLPLVSFDFGFIDIFIFYIKLHQQLQHELKQELRSCDGKYSLVSSINLIMAYYNRFVRMELTQKDVNLPFLQSFGLEIRLIGMYIVVGFNVLISHF